MGKTPRSPQNDDVPEETQRATRLRPEDIVARSFTTPVAAESNGGDGWSPRVRRTFFAAMAVAGALLFTVGLLLTGELGPGVGGGPTPLQSGPDAGALSNLLPATNTETPATPAPTPTPSPTAGPRAHSVGPAAVSPNQSDAVQPTSTPTTAPGPTTQTTQHNPTPTTIPCSILGSRALGAQIPPLCR